jgi:hypothetical protein
MIRYLLSSGHRPSCTDFTDKLHQTFPPHLDFTCLKTLVLKLQEDGLPNVLLVAVNVGQTSILVVVGLI